MSKIIETNLINNVVVIKTEGYLNNDLGEEIEKITKKVY